MHSGQIGDPSGWEKVEIETLVAMNYPSLPKSRLAGMLFLAAVAPHASAQAVCDGTLTFSIGGGGPTADGLPITEADILIPALGDIALGPLAKPVVLFQGGLDLGLAPGTELNALSFGNDPEIPMAPLLQGSLAYSVDDQAVGDATSTLQPSILTEGAGGGGADEAHADVFLHPDLGTPPLAPGAAPPRESIGFIDGDGLASTSGLAYPGTGLIEFNTPGPMPTDDLDALDLQGQGSTYPIYSSLDPATAGANGVTSAHVMVTTAPGALATYAEPAELGLDDGDDIDALYLCENGMAGFQVPTVAYDWTDGSSDLLLFSVAEGSNLIGVLDAISSEPILPGDVLVPLSGSVPGIFVAAEQLGLFANRVTEVSDELDAISGPDDTYSDCNENGIEDSIDIANDGSLDRNGNGVIDNCESVRVEMNEGYAAPGATPLPGETDEFIELIGTPGASLDGLVLLVIEGDQGENPGTLDLLVQLTGQIIPGDGYFVLGDQGVDNLDLPVVPRNMLENGTQTWVLARPLDPFAIVPGVNVDMDGDLEIDLDLVEVLDLVAIVDGGFDGTPAGDRVYNDPLRALGPMGTSVPPGIFRGGDYPNDWCWSSYLLEFPEAMNTPGLPNVHCGSTEETPIYGLDLRNGEVYRSRVNDFVGAQEPLGPDGGELYAVDFDESATTLWAVDNLSRDYGTLDLNTGAFQPEGNLLIADPSVTGMTCSTEGTWYLSTYDGLNSLLYAGDLSPGGLSFVGLITPGIIIDIAIDSQGNLFGHNISDDGLYAISTITGQGIFLGQTGLDANFAQGMDFDWSDDTLYAAVYVGTGVGAFCSLDVSNGQASVLQFTTLLDGEFEVACQAPAPVSDFGQTYCTAASNSVSPDGSRISATGSASILDQDLTLSADNAPTQPAIFYFGPLQVDAPFGCGRRCVGGSVFRMDIIFGSTGTFDYTVTPPFFSVFSPGSIQFQCWYRDPANAGFCGASFNLSDAIEIVFTP